MPQITSSTTEGNHRFDFNRFKKLEIVSILILDGLKCQSQNMQGEKEFNVSSNQDHFVTQNISTN